VMNLSRNGCMIGTTHINSRWLWVNGMAWHNKSIKYTNQVIPKQLLRVGEKISDVFFDSPRDFRQWANDNFTNVNEGDYFPTPNWRPNTIYLNLRKLWGSEKKEYGNGWLPNELIYIKYNPVYGKFDELEEYSQYIVDVLVFRAKFSPRDEAFHPVRSDAISVHVERRGLHYWTDMRAKSLFGDYYFNSPIYEIPFDLGTNCLNFPKGFK